MNAAISRSRTWALLILAAGGATALGQAEPPRSQVLDNARMFSLPAVQAAKRALDRQEATSQIPVVIETVESLDGASLDEAALRAARVSGGQGVFLFIAKKDQRVAVPLVRRQFDHRLPKEKREAIREALVARFEKGEADDGLLKAAEEIGAALKATATEAKAPASPLIARDQTRLTLAGARRAVAGAEAKAAEMGLKMNIAVVDDGGHLMAFARMDGARPAAAATAQTKAASAATYRQATGPILAGPNANQADPLATLALELAASAGGAKVTSLLGGVPILADGQVVGAIGVGGGTGEQDAEVAAAGVAAVHEDLKPAKPAEK